MTSLDKLWWSVHKSIFGIRNYRISKHVVSVLGNIWPPSLLYTNQVLIILHSTARIADILNSGNLAIILQHINMVRLFLVLKLSIVNRDPDEIKAIYIQWEQDVSAKTFRQKKFETVRHFFHAETSRIILILILVFYTLNLTIVECQFVEYKFVEFWN